MKFIIMREKINIDDKFYMILNMHLFHGSFIFQKIMRKLHTLGSRLTSGLTYESFEITSIFGNATKIEC